MRRGAKVLAFGGGGGGRFGGGGGRGGMFVRRGPVPREVEKVKVQCWVCVEANCRYANLPSRQRCRICGRNQPVDQETTVQWWSKNILSSSASWAATGHGKIPGRGRTLSSGPMGANLQEEFPCDSTLQPMRTMKGWRGRGAATTTSTGTRGLRRRSPRHSGNARGKKRESWRNIWEEGAGVRSRVGAGVWSRRHRGLNRRRGTETHEYTGHHNLSICHQCRGGFWLQGRQRCGRRKSRWRTGGGGAESAENRAMPRGYTAEHQECGG